MTIAMLPVAALFETMASRTGRFASSRRTLKGRAWWQIWSLQKPAVRLVVTNAIQALANALATAGAAPDIHARLRAAIRKKQTILQTLLFRDAVTEALESAIDVLTHSAANFSQGPKTEPDLAERLFRQMQDRIDLAMKDQRKYDTWAEGGFSDRLIGGEVLALAPGAHVWSKLLLGSHEELKRSSQSGAFMLGELSPLLSLWHRAVVTKENEGARAKRILRERLHPLGLAQQTSFAGTRPQPRPRFAPNTKKGGGPKARRPRKHSKNR